MTTCAESLCMLPAEEGKTYCLLHGLQVGSHVADHLPQLLRPLPVALHVRLPWGARRCTLQQQLQVARQQRGLRRLL